MINGREKDHPREKNPTIELSDQEYLDKQEQLKASKQMECVGLVYKGAPPEMKISPLIKKQVDIATNITKDTMDLRKEDEKSSSESPSPKPKKTHSKRNKTAVAHIQKELP